jgi:hypothetical protein
MHCEHNSAIGSDGNEYKNGDSVSDLDYMCSLCKEELVHVSEAKNGRRCHFRRKTENIMSPWHRYWQSLFENTEIPFITYTEDGANKVTRADATCGKYILEFQHSPLYTSTIKNREVQYAGINKELLWIIDGDNDVVIIGQENEAIINLFSGWKYYNFKKAEVEYIYLHKNNTVYRIELAYCTNFGHVTTNQYMSETLFIQGIKEGNLKWEEKGIIYQTCMNQIGSGAGSGKTWYMITKPFTDEAFTPENVIYLSKMNSAVTNLKKECEISNGIGMEEIDNGRGSKKYYYKIKGTYENGEKYICSLYMGTIDSFFYAICNMSDTGDKYTCSDVFATLAKKIGNEKCVNKLGSKGDVNWAGSNIPLDSRTVIMVDESQDIDDVYAKAILTIMELTHVCVYAIGDKLQSLFSSNNIMTIDTKKDCPRTVKIIHILRPNIVRRFHNKTFMHFVNNLVPFETFGLKKIEAICSGDDCGHDHDDIEPKIFSMGNVYKDEGKMCREIDVNIIGNMETLLESKPDLVPEDFLFIYPVLNQNKHAELLRDKLQEFWREKFVDEKYKNIISCRNSYWEDKLKNNFRPGICSFVQLHKAEDYGPIDLDTSKNKSRIVSIHTSKGDGRKIVFVLDFTEKSLCYHRTKPTDLKYESLVHVAVTRCMLRMYIGISDDTHDDIRRRITRMGKTYSPDNTATFRPDNTRHNHKVSHIADHYCKMPELHAPDIPKGERNGTIDLVHHYIRQSILRNIFNLYISNEIETTQERRYNTYHFTAILRNIQEATVEICKDTYDYEKRRKYLENSDVKTPVILLKGNYLDYLEELKNLIYTVQEKLKNKNYNFTNLEHIVLYFMTCNHISGNDRYIKGHHISVSEILDIVSNYTTNTSMCEKIHYEQVQSYVNNIQNIFSQISQRFPGEKFAYNVEVYTGYNDGFNLYGNVTVGFSENTVVIFRLHHNINEINWFSLCKEEAMTAFLVNHDSQSKSEVLNGKLRFQVQDKDGIIVGPKKIYTCFVSLEPCMDNVILDWSELVENYDTVIRDYMCNYLRNIYSDYNTSLKEYLKIQENRAVFLRNMNSQDKNEGGRYIDKVPFYIAELFQIWKRNSSLADFITENIDTILDEKINKFMKPNDYTYA